MTERNIQLFTLGRNRTIAIDTPVGLIRITRVNDDGTRKVRLDMPPGVNAHMGEGRAISKSRYLMQLKDGSIVPKFKMLVPVTTTDGFLVGVVTPEAFTLEE